MAWQYRDSVLAVSVAAFASTMLARLVVSPVVKPIIADFRVSKGLVGLALSGMWAAYALGQFPSGVLGERLGERRVVLGALAGTGVGAGLLAAAPSFPAFAAAAVLLGACAGFYFSPASSLLTRLFENTGQALGFHSAGGSIGGLVAPVLAASVGAWYGWRAALVAGAAVAVTVAALFAWRVDATAPTHPGARLRDRAAPGRLRELLSRPPVAYTTLVAAVTVFTWQAFASFFPAFLEEYHDYSTATAGLAFGGVFALSTLGLPAVGRLSDAYSRDGVLAGLLALTATGFVLALAATGPVGVAAAGACLGVGLSWGGVVQSRFMDRFGAAERGTGFGLVRTVYMLCGSLGSAVTGGLATAAGWPAAFGALVALLALAAASLAANRLLGAGL